MRAWLSSRRNLGEPDDGFYGFHLAEEGADTAELVVPPMLKQVLLFPESLATGSSLVCFAIQVDVTTHLVYNRRVVLLLLS